MAFGKSPYTRDALDVLIDRRVRAQGLSALPVPTALRADPMTQYEAPNFPTGEAAAPPPQPSWLQSGLIGATSDAGQQGFGEGVQAGLQQPNFLSALAASFGASVGGGARIRRADKQLEERLRVADERTKTGTVRGGTAGHRTRLEDLQGEQTFLKGLGWSDQQITDYYNKRGLGGQSGSGSTGGTGRLTDLDKVAQGLVANGRAKDINEAYVMARTLTSQPQQVGFITRSVMDQNYNVTTVRTSVSRRIDPVTGQFQLIDEQGNEVTPADLQTFRTTPDTYAGGTGGPAVQGAGAVAPPPPPPAPPSGIAPVPSHAPTGMTPAPAPAPAAAPAPTAAPAGDFVPRVQNITEDQIIRALMDPRTTPDTARQYAAGSGPMGNSTRIKALAAQILQRAQGAVQ